jgi:hypothetical protein
VHSDGAGVRGTDATTQVDRPAQAHDVRCEHSNKLLVSHAQMQMDRTERREMPGWTQPESSADATFSPLH